MAPKVKAKSGGSSPGLVVTLVFFILATISLGVSTYSGFSEQETKDKTVNDLKGKMKSLEKDRDWYKFQALLFRSYMGHLNKPDDQQTLKVNYDQYVAGTFGVETEKPDLNALMGNVEPRLAWNRGLAKPDKPFEQLVVDARKEKEALEPQIKQLEGLKTKAEKAAQLSDDKAVADKNAFDRNLADTSKKDADDKTDLLRKKDELQALVDQLGRDKDLIVKRADEERKKLETDIGRLKTELENVMKQLAFREVEIAHLKQKGTEAPREWRTDWKIVRIEREGHLAYINLGTVDNVQDQLTFSVHGLDLNRKPLPNIKGSVEVLNVIGEHLSQVRITSVRDRARDPILQGDVLYNPSWDPLAKKHVAITGIVDLTGEGRDNLQEFMRNLARQRIEVDAWIDQLVLREEGESDKVAEKAIKGRGIGVQTDYLIIGDGLEYLADSSSNQAQAFRKNLEKAVEKMHVDAKKNGVTVIGLRRYLEMIGYRLPRVTDRPVYRPNLPVMDQGKDKPKEPMNPPAMMDMNPPMNPPAMKDMGM